MRSQGKLENTPNRLIMPNAYQNLWHMAYGI